MMAGLDIINKILCFPRVVSIYVVLEVECIPTRRKITTSCYTYPSIIMIWTLIPIVHRGVCKWGSLHNLISIGSTDDYVNLTVNPFPTPINYIAFLFYLSPIRWLNSMINCLRISL